MVKDKGFSYKKTKMIIKFHFLKNVYLPNRLKLKSHLLYLSKKEKTIINELDIIFCSDDYLLKINNDFLGHNYFTDIITFDLTPKGSLEKTAELYISIDSIKHNASEYKTTMKNELHRVIFHGVLHLCGFKDKKPQDIKEMRIKEDQYLKSYFK